MSYLSKEKDLQNMVNSGQLMEAFEKYYADNVTLVEATGDKFEGKNEARKHEEEFLGKVQEFHGAGINKITSNEDEGTTMSEVWMEVTFKGMDAPVKMEQVAVKKWEGDHVVHERFYYNA
ncbi:nuclear transport factor 2 family protein [Fulvivirga sp. RKSG066]|uniref:SnoaL-like domain-containing protein n=1 Tax=Fulvivirga aurantia TaxID=2529383 RepID=UPI0012BB58EC|nr:SnoaL-like domain-containing protein [Fulvivirga aurantia]MTI22014.1 nuclear transport factor 2 family protein [Fulvivirga aurantia]